MLYQEEYIISIVTGSVAHEANGVLSSCWRVRANNSELPMVIASLEPEVGAGWGDDDAEAAGPKDVAVAWRQKLRCPDCERLGAWQHLRA